MSAIRPQTASFTFAILTLFAAAAWGQQNGTDTSVYESDNVVFGADSLSGTDLLQKTSLESDIEKPTLPDPQKPSNDYGQIDSLSGSSSKPLVDKNGYFIAAGGGGIWKDVTVEPQRSDRWASLTKPAVAKKPKATQESGQAESVLDSIEDTAAVQPSQPVDFGSLGQSKLRLRVGFDVLAFERSSGENTVFATDDDGGEVAFNDFDFSEGTARFFIQFMGDDQSGLELTFYDFNSFSSTIEADGDNVMPLFFQALPATPSASFDLNYSSRLKNIELNYWIRQNQLQRSGWGLRYINLDESFNVVGGFNNTLFSRTDNDFWGAHRMWERRRPIINRVTLTGGADAGLYLNRAVIDVDTLNIDDSSDANNIAGTLGFNLGVEYLAADHVTLRFGYEGLGIFGAALGSTQSLEQNIFDGLDDPELGSVYFGGFYFGAIAAF